MEPAGDDQRHASDPDIASRLGRGPAGFDDDLRGLLSAVDIPILVLDADLRIRWFTPGFQRAADLASEDVGRTLGDLAMRIDTIGLWGPLERVLDEQASDELQVRGKDGRWWVLRIGRSAPGEGAAGGVVVTLQDITVLRESISDLERSQRLDRHLNRVNAAVTSSLDLEQILEAVVLEAGSALESDSTVIDLRQGDEWVVAASRGASGVPVGRRFAGHEAPFLVRMATDGKVVAIDDAYDDPRTNPEIQRAAGITAVLAAPLVSRGEVVGALFFNYTRPRGPFGPLEVGYAEKIAISTSLALENAQLYRKIGERAAFERVLNSVHDVLTSEGDARRMVRLVIEAVVSALASGRALAALDAHGRLEVAAVVGLPSESLGSPLDAPAPHDAPHEASTRRSWLVPAGHPDVPDRRLAPAGRGRVLLVRLGPPRRLRGLLAIHLPEAAHDEQELLAFAVRLGDSVSLGLERARLYQAEHRTAEVLRARLAPVVTRVPGLDVGYAYRTAGESERVGGDFIDVLALDEGRVAVLLGDVMGRGVAAAGLTETIRNTVRVLLRQDPSPGFIFEQLNEILVAESRSLRFSTGFLMILDVESGWMVSTAAAQPPVLLGAGGTWRELGNPLSVPLGVKRGQAFAELEGRLESGSLLVAYTDGLIEARSDGRLFGEGRVRKVLASRAWSDAQQAVDAVWEDVTRFARGTLSDDVAILAVRRVGRA